MELGTLELAVSAFAWFSVYCVLCLINSKRSYEWHCRQVTCLHAVLVISLSFWVCFIIGPWPLTHPGGADTPNTWLEQLVCAISLGYFIFDFGWCVFSKTESFLMIMHHMVSLVGLSASFYRHTYGREMVAMIFGTEFTNPLLQLRWFLKETGNYNTWFSEFNDLIFMCVFAYLRVGLGTVFLINYWKSPKTDLFGRLGGLGMYVISFSFMLEILRFAFKKYSRMYSNWKQGKPLLTNDYKQRVKAQAVNGNKSAELNGNNSLYNPELMKKES